MTVEERIQVQQFCSSVWNAVFLILGLSIFGCAAWILWDTGSLFIILNSEELKIVAGGLFIIGLVVVGVSILGCTGSHLQNRFFLLLYMGFLIVIVLGQMFVTIVLVINRNGIEQSLEEMVDDIIVKYGINSSKELSPQEKVLDNVQHYGRCCGKTGPADWQMNIFIQNLSLTNSTVRPCSCFNTSKCPILLDHHTHFFGMGNHTFAEGCKEKITAWLEENTLTIVAMDLGLMFIQVLQFALAVCLYQTVGRKARLKKSSQLIAAEPQQGVDYAHPQQDYPDQDDVYEPQNQGYADGDHQDYMEPDAYAYMDYGSGHPEEYHDNLGYQHDYTEQNCDYPQPNQNVYDSRY